MLKWVDIPMVIEVVDDKEVEDKVKIQSRWKSREKFVLILANELVEKNEMLVINKSRLIYKLHPPPPLFSTQMIKGQ